MKTVDALVSLAGIVIRYEGVHTYDTLKAQKLVERIAKELISHYVTTGEKLDATLIICRNLCIKEAA